MPNIGNSPQFRALLWTNIEKILDLLYTNVAQLSNLSKVLSKKKDPITHLSFTDELIKVKSNFLRFIFCQNDFVFSARPFGRSHRNLLGRCNENFEKTIKNFDDR